MLVDRIEFESDAAIESWIAEFQKAENKDKIILPHVPYGWYSLINEWRRRQNLKT